LQAAAEGRSAVQPTAAGKKIRSALAQPGAVDNRSRGSEGGDDVLEDEPTLASGQPLRAKANLHGGVVDISPPKRAPNRPPGEAAAEKQLRRERAEAEKKEKGLTHERGVKAAAAAEDRAHEKEAEYNSRRLHPHLHSAQAVPAQKGAVKRRTTEENGQYTIWYTRIDAYLPSRRFGVEPIRPRVQH
jgi:hypothetical protein